jgi:transposase
MRPPEWQPPIELSTQEQKVVKRIKKAKLFIFLRQVRHELFDEEFQMELVHNGIKCDSLCRESR